MNNFDIRELEIDISHRRRFSLAGELGKSIHMNTAVRIKSNNPKFSLRDFFDSTPLRERNAKNKQEWKMFL